MYKNILEIMNKEWKVKIMNRLNDEGSLEMMESDGGLKKSDQEDTSEG